MWTIMRNFLFGALATALLAQAQAPVRLGIAGLNHGHVSGFLHSSTRRTGDVQIVGVYDPDSALPARYGKANQFLESTDL